MTTTTDPLVLTRGRALLETMRDRKVEDFTENGPDSGLPVVLIPWRGADQVATVVLGGDRDQTLAALRAVAGGFSPDCLVLGMETWMVSGTDKRQTDTNPDTGRPWDARNGDMAAYVERHGRNELVREALHVMALHASGDFAVLSQTFRVTAHQVHWDETREHVHDDDADGPAIHTGQFPDILRAGIRRAGRTSVFRSMIGDTFGQSQETITAITDVLAAQSLQGSGLVGAVLLSAREDEVDRRAAIERTAGRPLAPSVEQALRDADAAGEGLG